MTARHSIFAFFIVFAIGITVFAGFSLYHSNPQTSPIVSTLPDAFMEDVSALIFDKQGKPKMKIASPKMVHYAHEDTTHLTSPLLTLYRKSPQPWYVSAKHAKATDGLEHVNFWEDVVVQHAADQQNPATVIKSPTLTVHPNAQTAETTADIMMIQPNLVVRGTGMQADMNTGDIKLLSQTRGEYVPGS